jgi:pimeloyl-ACP methyl ester carboxylesterase
MSVAVVLVHGAFHGPWVWERVSDRLSRARPEVRIAAPDLYQQPCPSDPLVVQDAVDRLGHPRSVIVCGHSFGGLAISQLRSDSVAHLVYLAAMLPDATDWFPAEQWLVPQITGAFQPEGRQLILTEAGARRFFYPDCREEDIGWALRQLRPHPRGRDPASVEHPCWRRVPTTYVTCERDACVSGAYMRAATRRVGRGVKLPTGHSPMISHPDLVAELLLSLADGLDDGSLMPDQQPWPRRDHTCIA